MAFNLVVAASTYSELVVFVAKRSFIVPFGIHKTSLKLKARVVLHKSIREKACYLGC